MVLGIMLGSLLGLIIALILERIQWLKESETEEFEELLLLKRRAWQNILHPWRALRARAQS